MPTSADIRRELERLWRDKACLQPNHKLGLQLLTPAMEEKGGYWVLSSYLFVMVRGTRYPVKRGSKLRGTIRPYLTAQGAEYNYHKQRIKSKLTVPK